MAFTLPALPYAHDALEPHIDKMTMEIHHGKHHQAYVTNLNAAIEKAPVLAGKSLEELLANNCAIVPEAIRTAVRNNGGGHWNHSLFWELMGPGKGGAPVGNLAQAITGTFGGFEAVEELVEQPAFADALVAQQREIAAGAQRGQRRVGPHEIQEFQHDRRHAREVPGPRRAVPPVADPGDGDVGGKAVGIHRRDRRRPRPEARGGCGHQPG